jgi:hypothetical protein
MRCSVGLIFAGAERVLVSCCWYASAERKFGMTGFGAWRGYFHMQMCKQYDDSDMQQCRARGAIEVFHWQPRA